MENWTNTASMMPSFVAHFNLNGMKPKCSIRCKFFTISSKVCVVSRTFVWTCGKEAALHALILSINIVFIHGRFSFACSTAVWSQEREFQIWLTATRAIYVITDWEKAERLQSRCLKYWNFLLCVWMSVFVSVSVQSTYRATGFGRNL